jgi:hypothetical protein
VPITTTILMATSWVLTRRQVLFLLLRQGLWRQWRRRRRRLRRRTMYLMATLVTLVVLQPPTSLLLLLHLLLLSQLLLLLLLHRRILTPFSPRAPVFLNPRLTLTPFLAFSLLLLPPLVTPPLLTATARAPVGCCLTSLLMPALSRWAGPLTASPLTLRPRPPPPPLLLLLLLRPLCFRLCTVFTRRL